MNLVPFPSIRTNNTKDFYFTSIVNSSEMVLRSLINRELAVWGLSGYVAGSSQDNNANLTTNLIGSLFVRYSTNFNTFGGLTANDVSNSLYTQLSQYADPLPIGINGISHICMARNFVRVASSENTTLKNIRIFVQSLLNHPVSDASSHVISFPLSYVPVSEAPVTIYNPSFVDLRSPFTNSSQGYSRAQPKYKGRIVIDILDKYDEEARKEIESFFARIRSQENFFIVPLFREGESRDSDSPVNTNVLNSAFLEDGHLPYSTNVVAIDSVLRTDGTQQITLALNHRSGSGDEVSYRPQLTQVPSRLQLGINGFTLQPGNFVNINGKLAQIVDRVNSGIVINKRIPLVPADQAYPKNNSFQSNYVYWKEPFAIAKLDNPNYSNPYKPDFRGPWVIDWTEAL